MEKKFIINKIALVLLCVLSVGMVAIDFISFFDGVYNPLKIVDLVISIVVHLAIMYYALFAYKKPHGNELKFIMLFCLAFMMFRSLYSGRMLVDGKLNYVEMISLTTLSIAVLLMAYVSGRLDRIKENKIIFLVVIGLVIISTVFSFFQGIQPQPAGEGGGQAPAEPSRHFLMILLHFDGFVQLLTIMAAYLSRYALHKEAGLKDK